MKIAVVPGPAEQRAVDVLAVPVFNLPAPKAPRATTPAKKGKAQAAPKALPPPRFPELATVDAALGGVLGDALAAEAYAGDPGQTFSLHTHARVPARRVVVVGLGAKDKAVADSLRRLGGAAVKSALAAKAKRVAVAVPQLEGVPGELALQLVAEGALLASYRFDRYLTKEKQKPQTVVEELELVVKGRAQGLKGIAKAEAVAQAVALARDLVNEPASVVTPRALAEQAQRVAKEAGLKVTILDEKGIEKERMGMVAAVARAAAPYNPPRIVKLAYRPAKKARRKIVLVGKGLTFDTGGLDLKPSASMLDMKIDMSGAAAVLGTMLAVGKLQPNVEVVGYLGCVENGIGGNAYHPGDVLVSRKGLTVEINNTDAEGRLVLGDVIDLALTEEEPDVLVDLATLTGACMVALGPTTAGLFSTEDRLADELREAGRRAGEDFWRMPLNEDLFGQLKSGIADMKNTGERYGGAITAALFLKQFVDGRAQWAHLDIAGPVTTDRDGDYTPKGATGFGVRTLLSFLQAA